MKRKYALPILGLFAACICGCTDSEPAAPDSTAPAPAAPAAAAPAALEKPLALTRLVFTPVTLPAVDGLLTKTSQAKAPQGQKPYLRKLTVAVKADGSVRADLAQAVSHWRGFGLPRVPSVMTARGGRGPQEVRIKISADGQIMLDRMPCADAKDLRRKYEQMAEAEAELNLVLDPSPKLAFGKVLPVLTVLTDGGLPFQIQAPRIPEPGAAKESESLNSESFAALRRRIAKEVTRVGRDKDDLARLVLKIRADQGARYGAVQEVVVLAMRAYVWRITFTGLDGGREVEIGPVWFQGHEPPKAPATLFEAPIAEKPLERDVLSSEPIVKNPVIVHEKVEIVDHIETEIEMDRKTARGREDAISDIPLGSGPGIGNIGVGGGGGSAYGFRTGGGRRSAVGRFGGSSLSERAVNHALEWLARHQEADGSWKAGKHGGGKKMDPAVTGLALLAFLGAGNTEKTGKFKVRVKHAVAWLISRQDGSGAIGGSDPDRLGYHHAICGLALAEAYGMAKMPRTGKAAQKAIDYTCDKHQVVYSGWGFRPKAAPNNQTYQVTAWMILQIKSAKVVGLKVPGEAFQGAMNWLDKIEVKKKGRAGGVFAVTPGREADAGSTARGVFSRLILGWKPKEFVGGAELLLKHAPDWQKKDFAYWHFGTLAMFQMGGDPWKAWNRAMRDMLVQNQRKGGHEDGSWDPEKERFKPGGRVYTTALGALCLEVYYRYLPMYKK